MSCRLPACIIPTHYDLTYTEINLVSPWRFAGSVKITLDVDVDVDASKSASSQKVGNSVTLHCLELSIFHAALSSNGSSMDAVSFNYSRTNETCTIVFPNVVPSGSGVLEVEFEGNLNDQMRGLYRSTYKGLDGEVKTMACTQVG